MATKNKQTALHAKIRRSTTKHAKLALVPHKANQYKPHLIRRYGLLAILVAVVAAQFVSGLGVFRGVLGDEASVSVPTLLAGTNREREKASLAPLTLDTRLSDAAYLKAKDMLAKQYWAHTSPDGTQPWQWFAETNYNYSYAGENLARNFTSSQTVVNAWMSSPAHRDNIMKSEYKDVGFATVDGTMNGRPVSLVVALYGAPAQNSAVAVKGAENFAASMGQIGILARVGIALQQMSPAVLGSVVLLILAAGVAVVAHAYRRYIPKYLQSTWQHHHGLAKALGLSCLVVVMIALYGTNVQL